MHNSKDDALKRGTMQDRRHHPIHKSRVYLKGSKRKQEHHLSDAIKKDTTPKVSPSPGSANTESKVSLGSSPPPSCIMRI
jgi:hypothetical protein